MFSFVHGRLSRQDLENLVDAQYKLGSLNILKHYCTWPSNV